MEVGQPAAAAPKTAIAAAHAALDGGRIDYTSALGMPSLRGRERGDLLVSLKVETPVRLTARQKELMRELAATMATGDGHHPRQTGFFDKAKRFWNGVVGGAEGTAG